MVEFDKFITFSGNSSPQPASAEAIKKNFERLIYEELLKRRNSVAKAEVERIVEFFIMAKYGIPYQGSKDKTANNIEKKPPV